MSRFFSLKHQWSLRFRRLHATILAGIVLPLFISSGVALAYATPTLSGSINSTCYVSLSWTNESADSYDIRKDGSTVYNGSGLSWSDPVQFASGATHSYTIASYYNALWPTNGGETTQSSPPLSFTCTPPPVAPASPVLSGSAGDTTASLSWTAPSGAVSYDLTRDGTNVYSGTSTTFSDSALSNGTLYSYSVTATNTGGTSPVSNTVALVPMVVTLVTTRDVQIISFFLATFIGFQFLKYFVWSGKR